MVKLDNYTYLVPFVERATKDKELLNSVEKGEWQSIDNLSEEIKRYQSYANHQINKNKIEIF
jgi:hypothetical protein